MNVGDYKVSFLNFGNFRLDGGSMFGSVPKNLWSKLIPVDEENCIPLATRCLVLEGHGRKILVDCGNGTKWDEKRRKIFNIQAKEPEALGLDPNTVTDVVLTHLHFDHCGGISNSKGERIYKKAKIWVQKTNFENAKNPSIRERASYLEENYKVIESGDRFLIEGDKEIFPNVKVHVINGHTKGQQWIEISDNNDTLLYPSDLMPTSRHLQLPYHMGYDMCVDTLLNEKKIFLDYAVSKNALIVFQHDPDVESGRIKMIGQNRFELE